jgi:hypothetical protein
LYKSPKLYGAFPTDAYSHTPGNAGAQQPGMTGQVKEDFISRMRELGVQIENGKILFQPSLLNPNEILTSETLFCYFDLLGEMQQISLKVGQLGFTVCQVPVIYTTSGEEKIIITFNNGKEFSFHGNTIANEESAKLFQRTGEIVQVEVFIRNLDNQN